MIKSYILAFIIFTTFCGLIHASDEGDVVIADHQRAVSVWAPPNEENIQYFLLGKWEARSEKIGDNDNLARATQKSNIDYIYGTKLIVPGAGSTYIRGASAANTYIRVDFVVRNGSVKFKIIYNLTDDAIIQLYEDWIWGSVKHTFTGKGKEADLPLQEGSYRLWVNSDNISSFNMCFAIPSSDEVCEEFPWILFYPAFIKGSSR